MPILEKSCKFFPKFELKACGRGKLQDVEVLLTFLAEISKFFLKFRFFKMSLATPLNIREVNYETRQNRT